MSRWPPVRSPGQGADKGPACLRAEPLPMRCAPRTGHPRRPRPAPEELLQAGVAEAVAAGRNLHGLSHGLPAQRAQQPPLGLLQELVVEAGHGGRARASGAGHAAAPQPAPRSGRAPGSGRRRLLAAARPSPPARGRKRGRSRARVVLAPVLAALPSHPGTRGSEVGAWPGLPPPRNRGSSFRLRREIVAPLPPRAGELRTGGGGMTLTLDGAEGPGVRAGPRHKGLFSRGYSSVPGATCRPGARDCSFQVLGSRSLATRSRESGSGGEAGLALGQRKLSRLRLRPHSFLDLSRPCSRDRGPSPTLGCWAATPPS